MIDSIGGKSNAVATQRSQAATQTSGLRSADVLSAVTQTQQRKSGATAPVKIFAVPQSANASATGRAKVPRGSLVDELV